MWEGIGIAFALLLILEGIMPFLSPRITRQSLVMMIQMDDRTMRITGFICMLCGMVLLYTV